MRRAAGFATALAVLAIAPSRAAAQSTVLVQLGSPMVYLDNQSDPGIGLSWIEESFTDPSSQFAAGTFGVGYGAGSLVQTAVPNGTESVYTRAEFSIADPGGVQTLFLGADWDDGYVAWINGVEVYRSPQMPAGVPQWNTDAGLHESSNGVPPNYGGLINISAAAIPVLHAGNNILAVGVFNAPLPSSDLVVVPLLVMNLPGPAARGPYLQMGTDTSVTVKWRTSTLSDSRVSYGIDPNDLSFTVDDPAPVMDHEVTLSGLSPDTIYRYSAGSTTETLHEGDGHFFRTAPPAGSRRPIRVWVLGDSGTGTGNAQAVGDAYEALSMNEITDLWLMLGDNAYPNGTDGQYQSAVFAIYPDMLRRSVLWPTLGNHDAVSSASGTLTGPYYDIFTLPAGGEAGGMPSGTEAYYSFDFGNIHFVCLNSEDVDRSPAGAMLSWLESDLVSTSQDWIIAFFHHPPYSKGSHDSDDPADSGMRLIDMRTNALPILEDHGVDLVLAGHSHSYERSFLLDGHYGLSASLVPSMVLDGGDGRIEGDGAYQKATAGASPHEGAVYVVAGSSGQTSGGALDHPAMFISLNSLGSLVLDAEGDRLTGRFIDHLGAEGDRFTIVKDTETIPQADFTASPTVGAAPLSVDFSDASSTNASSWSWDLDGDAIEDSAQRNPSFVYTATGLFTVGLAASNQSGSDQETKTDFICVTNGPPGNPLILDIASDAVTLSWDPQAGADAYDVVKGDLGLLRSTNGDFGSSILACLEDGGSDTGASDVTAPAPEAGFYYLVRAESVCAEPGTYDSSTPGQAAGRDASIAASPHACP